MTTLEKIHAATREGKLLPAASENLAAFLGARLPEWAQASIEELAAREAWSELNDRFYRYLEFGTGGMRGRTIGRVTAAAETGEPDPLGTPRHAAVGSNMLNDFTLARATIGLFRYTAGYLRSRASPDRPRLVIAHDVRHFSRHFCELAASTWTRLGGQAFIFDGPRPTPQLSFSVRWLKAHAGVVITASHNPPHDNGFKAYFEDGGQVVPPHDQGIVAEVNAVPLGELGQFLDKNLAGTTQLGWEADDTYIGVAAKSVLDPPVFSRVRLRVAYTNIHGTGGVHCPPLLIHAGCEVFPVREQLVFDPRFPTVKSPNPENAEALSRAVALAESGNCDLVLATDPDCDRMGAAVRNRAGRMELLSGNQIGALLADYRLRQYRELGWIPRGGSERVCLIKTLVTTGLQDAIGRHYGVKVVNTLTGFKWIAAKLRIYEEILRGALGPGFDYDYVRDKDGNAACLMFAEVCAWVKARGLTMPEYLDELYACHGFYLEGVINLYYEGATGQAKIQRILDTYRAGPPAAFGDARVVKFQDFGRERILDADGAEIPRQDLYLVALDNGCSFAARGSGTEPKMKFYLFAHEPAPEAGGLPAVKARVKATLESLSRLIEADARARAEG
jgi:phosphoglucomutase